MPSTNSNGKRRVRTNLTIASSGTFKDAVLQLAMQKNVSISEFVRQSLIDAYPRLQKADNYSEYAVKRNPRLRAIQEQKQQNAEGIRKHRERTISPDDKYLPFDVTDDKDDEKIDLGW